MPKTYDIYKGNHDVEVFQNEHNGKYKLLISESNSVAPALDGAYWLGAEELIKLGIKIAAIGFLAVEKLPDKREILARCEKEGIDFTLGLENDLR